MEEGEKEQGKERYQIQCQQEQGVWEVTEERIRELETPILKMIKPFLLVIKYIRRMSQRKSSLKIHFWRRKGTKKVIC